MAKVLVIAGSTREKSYNKQLAHCITRILEELGAQATFVDLRDYPMPLYDGDIEHTSGIPEKGLTLNMMLQDYEAFVFVSPEYNSGVSAVMKNMIDWTSRAYGKTPRLAGYKGKIAYIASASPSALGGLRGLYHLRYVLENIGVLVLPELFTLPKSHEAFDKQGELVDEQKIAQLKQHLTRLLSLL